MIKKPNLKEFLYGVLAIKFTLLSIASFVQIPTPHIHRQMDTLGVSLRYYQKFFIEEFSLLSLLPSVLQAGDSAGITAMEFPFINIVLSPFFSISSFYKVQAALIAYYILTICLYLCCIKA